MKKIIGVLDKLILTSLGLCSAVLSIGFYLDNKGFFTSIIVFAVGILITNIVRAWVKWLLKDFAPEEMEAESKDTSSRVNKVEMEGFADNLISSIGCELTGKILELFQELSKGDEEEFIKGFLYISSGFSKGKEVGIDCLVQVLSRYVERMQAGELSNAHRLAILGYREEISEVLDIAIALKSKTA